MVRLCGRYFAVCKGRPWSSLLLSRRLSSGQKVSSCQNQRTSRCVLVNGQAKQLGTVAEDGAPQQVSLLVM